MSDLPIYGASPDRARRTRRERSRVSHRSLLAIGVGAAVTVSAVALAASTPSEPSYAPYYLPPRLPDGWALAAVEVSEPIPAALLATNEWQDYAHVDDEGFTDKFLSISTTQGPAGPAQEARIIGDEQFVSATFTVGDCAASLAANGLDTDAVDEIVHTARCEHRGKRRRVVVTPPFEATIITDPRSTTQRSVGAVYRRTDGAVLYVGSGRRDLGPFYGAAAERRRERRGYGYLRSIERRALCPEAVGSLAWRYDGNRIVIASGDVDRETVADVLRGVERVTGKRWHDMTDPVADRPLPERRPPCDFSDT